MKTLIILMAAILVTSIQTFAQADINDIEIKCSLAEAKQLVPALMERYQIPESENGDTNTRLLGNMLKEAIVPLFNSSEEAGKIEPEETAELIKEAVCLETLAFHQSGKNVSDKQHADMKARSAKIAEHLSEKLSKIPENPEGDQIFEQATYKMFRANSRTLTFIFMAFSDETK